MEIVELVYKWMSNVWGNSYLCMINLPLALLQQGICTILASAEGLLGVDSDSFFVFSCPLLKICRLVGAPEVVIKTSPSS